MSAYEVIVIGGGAAGLMAAGQAAAIGAHTLLLEKMDQPGRKLFITGKFRCNLTNTAPIPEFIQHFGLNGRFLRQAFHRFSNEDLVRFFHDLGISTVTERGGRVFPASGRSQDVVQALVKWCGRCGVEIKTYTPVEKLLMNERQIEGVRVPDGEIQGGAVIIATGGASYPGTGSTGDGYRLAEEAGHQIVPIRPALVPLTTRGEVAQELQGLSLRNVSVRVHVDGKQHSQKFGEMLFTHFGVSGPVILTLSRQVVDALEAGKPVSIYIDLKPALEDDKLNARLLRDLDSGGKKQFHSMLKGLLPRKMIPVCLDVTAIPGDKACHQITSEERHRLHKFLKDFRLEVDGHRGFRHAIVTAGGVDLREIDPRTMASRLVKGLYFGGEVLDVDADTGGYNLQAAFSTGWLAGRSAAQQYGDHNE
jgi:predicted Rossmann fold flavoprotein